MLWLQVRISVGRALKERQYTLEGQLDRPGIRMYGVLYTERYSVGEWTLEVQIF